MGIEYILYHRNSAEISAIVQELKDLGYRVGLDFDFAYHTGSYDWATIKMIPRKTVFTFYREELASWFVIKWS